MVMFVEFSKSPKWPLYGIPSGSGCSELITIGNSSTFEIYHCCGDLEDEDMIYLSQFTTTVAPRKTEL